MKRMLAGAQQVFDHVTSKQKKLNHGAFSAVFNCCFCCFSAVFNCCFCCFMLFYAACSAQKWWSLDRLLGAASVLGV